MLVELGTIAGAVVLKDAFSGVLDKISEGIGQLGGIAKDAFPSIGKFAEDMAPAFGLASVAIVATTAAVTGLVAATVALGERGANVSDVAGTLEHFSGSTEVAAANLGSLRAGVQGTVSDFELMKTSSKLLSTGVKLNASDFNQLGEAAFVLQNRGLGGTKEMLDVVSDALTTGKTKALAAKLGVVDLGDAQANYAKQLGVEATQLSDAGKAEAARIQIMKMLGSAVADAGTQEKDFGEKIEAAQAQFQNWIDDLAVAVSQSPVLTAAIDTLSEAWGSAFGGDNTALIESVVGWIEQGLIHTVDFAMGIVEFARVAHTAWEGVKVLAEGLAVSIGTVISVMANAVTNMLELASSIPGVGGAFSDAAAMAGGFRDSVEETTMGLMANTQEALLAVAGYDDFNNTLDSAGTFLSTMRNKMVDASLTSKDHKKATDDNAAATKGGTKANQDNTASMIDQTKMQDLQKKGLEAATKLWGEYNKLVTESSGTSFDAQRAAIEQWKNDLIAQHKSAHTDTKEFYEAIEATAGQKLDMIGSHWGELADQSRESLKDQAEAAGRDYQRMKESGLHFGDVLDAQLKKWMDLQDKANGFKAAGEGAMKKTGEETDKTTEKVRMLNGELVSLAEAEKRRSQGGSFDVTSQNFEQTMHDITNPWWNPTGQGSNIDMVEAFKLAKQGYSFQEILDIFSRRKTGNAGAPIPPPRGPRIPGFAEGGVVMVGEKGPELVALPSGSAVMPSGRGGGVTVINHFSIAAPTTEMARLVISKIEQTMRSERKWPTT